MKYLIGVDEAGRGPLAGPLVVSALLIRDGAALMDFMECKDSKQLSERQRAAIIRKLHAVRDSGYVAWRIARVSPRFIDLNGITRAAKEGVRRCLSGLMESPDETDILLDGALYAPAKYPNKKTISGGDWREPIIALASVLAKEARDADMRQFAKKYPHYGFEKHKGYGTRTHYENIRIHGLSPIHRTSFLLNTGV